MGDPRDSLLQRWWKKVEVTETCWLWKGALNGPGYGKIWTDEGLLGAHVVAFQMFVAPIPEGYEIDHLCRNPQCCRPDHLEAVTNKENQRRARAWAGANASRTHCKNGHPYAPPNMFYDNKGYRRCRACAAVKAKKQLERRKARKDPVTA